MLIHPQIDPVALRLGPLSVHWYGLTYLAAFLLFVWLGRRRLRHPAYAGLPGAQAWSARDVANGAWNLRVLPPFRWLALNYHYHLAHHQQPQLPWYELPRHVDRDLPQPSFWRVYFSLWKGVRPAPPMGAPADLDFLFPRKARG